MDSDEATSSSSSSTISSHTNSSSQSSSTTSISQPYYIEKLVPIPNSNSQKRKHTSESSYNSSNDEKDEQESQQHKKAYEEFAKSSVEKTVTTVNLQQPSLFTFSPFPKYSVNIVTGPTFVGKTYFLTQLVNNYKTYFDSRVDRVVVVLCNSRVKSISFDQDLDVPVEQVLLSDFAPDYLEDNDLVIIDDLQHLTPEVKLTISVCAHHQSLASLFVVTHSLLGTKNFELLSLCHRIFLFLGSTANNRLTAYILDRFYTDPIVKTYLKTVLNFCSSENQVLALELSPIGHSPQVVLAFSHLLNLHISGGKESTSNSTNNKGFCLLYPTPHFSEKFVHRFTSEDTTPVVPKTESIMSIAFLHSDSTRKCPANTLIALPVQYVTDHIVKHGDGNNKSKNDTECMDRKTWETTLEDIEDNIEAFFPFKRWKVCKNLAKEILGNSNFCITKDGKYFHLAKKPNTKVNLLSFLGAVTRKAGPNEKAKKSEWKGYDQHIKQLLSNGTPKELFVNTLLVNKNKK